MTREIIVTGGRNYSDYDVVKRTLDFLQPSRVIQGGAAGADGLARRWCRENNVPCLTYDADWEGHGRFAGPIRNGVMLKEHPEAAVVGFPGGNGTKDCLRQALGQKNRVVLKHGAF